MNFRVDSNSVISRLMNLDPIKSLPFMLSIQSSIFSRSSVSLQALNHMEEGLKLSIFIDSKIAGQQLREQNDHTSKTALTQNEDSSRRKNISTNQTSFTRNQTLLARHGKHPGSSVSFAFASPHLHKLITYGILKDAFLFRLQLVGIRLTKKWQVARYRDSVSVCA